MNGTSEKWLGELIASDRDYFVVSTKYTNSTRPGDPNACGNHRKHMMQALDASLKRLNTDYIDLYWLHTWDFTTPIEEVLRALDDAISAGKVLYTRFAFNNSGGYSKWYAHLSLSNSPRIALYLQWFAIKLSFGANKHSDSLHITWFDIVLV